MIVVFYLYRKYQATVTRVKEVLKIAVEEGAMISLTGDIWTPSDVDGR